VCDAPVPLVLQFHGYPGSSRSWLEQSSYAGMGMAIIALDCPGQEKNILIRMDEQGMHADYAKEV
jgi:cephalosporin-C deacetylase-like acetyl esterase